LPIAITTDDVASVFTVPVLSTTPISTPPGECKI
jgi:hypothetical protein